MPVLGSRHIHLGRRSAHRRMAGGGLRCVLLVSLAGISSGQSLEVRPSDSPASETALDPSGVPRPQCVRSLRVELHYRLASENTGGRVVLWYTRDLGATWQRYGLDDGVSPMLFEAPAEGLYGVTLISETENGSGPEPNTSPQRWLFLDATPPLVQWNRVEPGDDFTQKRLLHLRWTAHDSHLSARPVTLMYQCSLDQVWRMIETEVSNGGRYDWEVPAHLTGQVALKIIVRDRGGHAVERVLGPVPIARWLEVPTTSQPAATATAPAETSLATAHLTRPWHAAISEEDRQKARHLYEAAALCRKRQEYDVAAERLKEALSLDPGLLSARNDLGGLYYLRQDYGRAIEQYLGVLEQDEGHINALRGAALTYMATRDYPKSQDMLKRVLERDEGDAASWLDLGDVLFMMGDENQARTSWKQAGLTDETKKALIAARARQRLARLSPTTPRLQAVVGPGAQASTMP